MKDKVVVFGGSGFLGSHVADALTREGYEVVLFDREASPYRSENQTMVVGDLLDRETVRGVVEGAGYVYHFAGIADIAESSRRPWETMQANVLGSCAILDACVGSTVKRLVFASSMYVYSDLGSFYRVSKQACEKLIEEYAREFGLEYTILRIGTPYGPRANPFNSIGKMMHQAYHEKKITYHGAPDEVREYLHVSDLAGECIRCLETAYRNLCVIMTGNEPVRLDHLTLMIKEILGDNLTIEYQPRKDPNHYRITPYGYKPEKALKVVPHRYHDLGQGLLELLYDLGKKGSEEET